MNERRHIEKLKKELIRFHNWEGKEQLMQRDFEHLSKAVMDKVRVRISPITFRRILTNQNQGLPQVKTLQALANYLGYNSWEDFRHKCGKFYFSSLRKKRFLLHFLIFIGTLVLTAIVVIAFQKIPRLDLHLQPEKNIYDGIPATVGFHYKVQHPNAFIQLSWNDKEKFLLDPSKNYFTATYFYPDYHEAKIILENELITSKKIYVTEKDWVGMLLDSPDDIRPIRIDSSHLSRGGKIGFNESLSKEYNLSSGQRFYTLFTYSNESLSSISLDEFKLSSQLKLTPNLNDINCNYIQIFLKAERGNVVIPIFQSGCHGLATLSIGETIIKGRDHDLSKLTYHFNSPLSIKFIKDATKLTIYSGVEELYSIPDSFNYGKLKTIKILMSGFGTLSKFNLKNNDKVYNLIPAR